MDISTHRVASLQKPIKDKLKFTMEIIVLLFSVLNFSMGAEHGILSVHYVLLMIIDISLDACIIQNLISILWVPFCVEFVEYVQ